MTKVGRNAPCPCGSGKKYKKCCTDKDLAEEHARVIGAPDNDIESEEPADEEYEDLAGSSVIHDGAWDEDEDWDDDEPVTRREPLPEPTHYPKPCEDLPELPAEQSRIVEDWWKETMPFFKKNDADRMIENMVGFMERHPDLFVHLGLEHEFFFKLGAELGRRKEWSRYVELLMRVRNEHTEMYVRSFSYYDCDVIIELIVSGRFKEVPLFFNFFHQYPDSAPDNAHRVIDLLAWTGRQDELFEFVAPIAVPMWKSADVLGGWFILRWLVFARYVQLLDARTNPAEAATAVIEAIEELDIPNGPEPDKEIIQREFQLCRETPQSWDFKACRTDQDVNRFYHEVRWNYCGFLHNVKGFPWVRAYLLSDRLEDYWSDRPSGKKPKKPFRFVEQRVEGYIVRTCSNILCINGVPAISLIEGIRHFADYLSVHSWLEGETLDGLHDMCRGLYERCLPALDSTDPAPRLMTEFPEMKCL